MVRTLINIYIILLIVDAILSYLPQFRHTPWARQIRKMADFTLNPVRKVLPPDLPFDISPLIVIFLLRLLVALW